MGWRNCHAWTLPGQRVLWPRSGSQACIASHAALIARPQSVLDCKCACRCRKQPAAARRRAVHRPTAHRHPTTMTTPRARNPARQGARAVRAAVLQRTLHNAASAAHLRTASRVSQALAPPRIPGRPRSTVRSSCIAFCRCTRLQSATHAAQQSSRLPVPNQQRARSNPPIRYIAHL